MSALRTPGDFERLGRVETFKPASGASRRKHLGGTMADLDRKVFPPLREIVPGVLPEGLTILGGRIKLGKSWMMYDISTAIGYGGYAFGSIAVEQGDVLHLALEDGERWVQTRLRQMLGDTPKPERVELLERFPRLDLGGLDEIEAWAEEAVNPRLVVVDTLVRARRPRGGNEDWYCYDYASIEPLKALADRFRMAVVVHHLNKSQGATDPFDLISGSNGLAACADSTLILARLSSSTGMVKAFAFTGADVMSRSSTRRSASTRRARAGPLSGLPTRCGVRMNAASSSIRFAAPAAHSGRRTSRQPPT